MLSGPRLRNYIMVDLLTNLFAGTETLFPIPWGV